MKAAAGRMGLAGWLMTASCAAAVLGPVTVAEAATVNRILVQGNQRVDDETVKAYLLVEPGRPFTAFDVDESLKALFATGLFSDVTINQRGGALVVQVEENPVLSQVAFEGNKKVKDEQLQRVVSAGGRDTFTRARVQRDVQNILELYRRSGRFQATVEPKIIQLPNGRVNLVYEIEEGPRTDVSSVNFIGNKAFSDRRLRDEIETQESGILSFLSRRNTYDPDKLNADEERLRRFYVNRGYADAEVISAVADLDRERNSFFITFTLDEGQRYRIGNVRVDSAIPNVDSASLRDEVITDPGDIFSAEDVDRTLEEMTLELAGSGYAFAQVRPRIDRNPEAGTIDVTYVVDEGPRAYVERIEIVGNSRTRDYVLRREFDIAEGDAFNRVLIDRAERRLRNLNYFETVRITTRPGSQPDQVIVVVNVEEKPTGEIGFSAGYTVGGDEDGLSGDISVTEHNFLGRGYVVRASVGASESTRKVAFAFTDPYFLGRRISSTIGVSYSEKVAEDDDDGLDLVDDYSINTVAGNIGFGFPIREDLIFQVGYKAEYSEIDREGLNLEGVPIEERINACPRDANGRRRYSLAVCQAEGDTFKSIGYYGLVYDTLDSRRDPKDGLYLRFSQEFAGLGGDVSFVRTTANGSIYHELVPDYGIVGLLRATAGNITGLGEDVRIVDSFFKGGETIRGFAPSGFVPQEVVFNSDGSVAGYTAIGATNYVAGTAEVQFDFPLLPRELGFRGAVFADVGTAFGTDVEEIGDTNGDGIPELEIFDEAELRSSVGASILWNSPIGPLRADYAQALTSAEGDEEQEFRFSTGARF